MTRNCFQSTQSPLCAGRMLLLVSAIIGGQACLGGHAVRTGCGAADTDSPARIPWTKSRIIGSPDPPAPYEVEAAFPRLSFQEPVDICTAPGSKRYFVVERAGKIYSFGADQGEPRAELFLDLASRLKNLEAIYGLTFHPEFEKNHYCYVCYVLKGEQPDGSRVRVSKSAKPIRPIACSTAKRS